jgi:hypothetical protein
MSQLQLTGNNYSYRVLITEVGSTAYFTITATQIRSGRSKSVNNLNSVLGEITEGADVDDLPDAWVEESSDWEMTPEQANTMQQRFSDAIASPLVLRQIEATLDEDFAD